ncbi:MAG TPA: ATP-binding protein, partial [Polyangiales bacterium]|nr:ATP-binding protein [Polyangiales bacterium]
MSDTDALVSGIEQLTDGVVLFDLSDCMLGGLRIVYANEAFARALALDPTSSLSGQSLLTVLPNELRAPLASVNFEHGSTLHFAKPGAAGLRRFSLTFSPVRSNAGSSTRLFGFLRETTPEADERARWDQERLAAAARLAAGLLHEVNNPLASVTTNLEWLATALPGLGATTAPIQTRSQTLATVSAALVDALTGAERVETSIENLSLLSGINYTGRELLDLRSVLDAVLTGLEPLFGQDIQIERRYADDVPLVFASERRLRQALAAILTNAAQALEPMKGRRVVVVRVMANSSVRIEIEDNGPGIAEEHR